MMLEGPGRFQECVSKVRHHPVTRCKSGHSHRRAIGRSHRRARGCSTVPPEGEALRVPEGAATGVPEDANSDAKR
eukprot:10065039-Prorocentrum_lima.AAC.1